jgi:tetratricopeptide (TPR) repeat protein
VAWLYGYRAWIWTEMGRLDDAADSLREFQEAVRGLPRTESESWVETVWAMQRECVGDFRGALSHARHAVDAAEKVGSNLTRIFARRQLGRALALAGEEPAAATEQLELALSTARETRSWLVSEATILAALAEARLAAGDAEGGQRTAEEGIETARRRGTPVWEAQAQLALARVLLTRFGAEARGEIERALVSCLSLVERTEARVYEPHVHELRAELAHLLGDELAHRRELREAHRRFSAMGATGHTERLVGQLGSEVP